MNVQQVDLYKPIANTRIGPPPMTLRISTTPNVNYMANGVPQNATKVETYVLLSVLPTELQERVKLAVQALLSSI